MLLNKKIRTSGIFWLQNHPEHKFQGDISITKKGNIKVKLIEYEPSENSFELLQKNKIDILHGITENLGIIQCHSLHAIKHHCFQPTKTIYKANFIYTNLRPEPFDPSIISKLVFSTVRLNEWFHNAINNKSGKLPLTKINNFSINIVKKASEKASLNYSKQTQNYCIEIVPEEKVDLKGFNKIAFHLMRLISFAMDDIYPLTNIETYYENNSIIPSNIYFNSVFSNNRIPTVSEEHFLFTFQQIENNISMIVTNWFSLTETIEPALNLYFAVRIHQDNFLETRFILMAQCLETLHSWNTKTYNKRSRDFSFRYRIEELISPFKEYIEAPDDLSKNISLIRNYYTHYNADESKKLEGLPETIRILYQMKAIFQLNILKLLSFSEEEIDTIVQNNRQLQWNLWMIEE